MEAETLTHLKAARNQQCEIQKSADTTDLHTSQHNARNIEKPLAIAVRTTTPRVYAEALEKQLEPQHRKAD